MTIHHTKHHNTYVTNLNATLEKMDAAMSSGDVSGLIGLQGALKFNGGGHINHTLFWENLGPNSSAPSGDLATAIDASFGGLDKMKAEMSAKTVAVQGSGWGWLGYNKSTGRIEVATCANQDPLEATTGLVPLMGIDVWEHAYYVSKLTTAVAVNRKTPGSRILHAIAGRLPQRSTRLCQEYLGCHQLGCRCQPLGCCKVNLWFDPSLDYSARATNRYE